MDSGSIRKDRHRSNRKSLFFLSGLLAVIPISIGLVVFSPKRSERLTREAWTKHQARVRTTPIDEYRLDRARKLSGVLTLGDVPVADAEVQVINVDKTLEKIRANPQLIFESDWEVIEATATTSANGIYEIQGLTVGVKAVASKQTDKGLGFKSMVVVQDGVGSRANLELVRARRIQVEIPDDFPQEVDVIVLGTSWSPIFHTAVQKSDRHVEFDCFDDPSCNSLVLAQKDSVPIGYAWVTEAVNSIKLMRFASSANWKSEVISDRLWLTSASWNMWQSEVFSDNERKLLDFYAYQSPIAAFLSDSKNSIASLPTPASASQVTGLTIAPHSPVIVSSISGDFSTTVQSDDAMEFRVACDPGIYVVRTFGWNGHLSHLKVATVGAGQTKDVSFNRFDQWRDFVEKGRIVGVVDSALAMIDDQLEIVIQDAENFRRFIHRVPVKDGNFAIGEVPLNRPYIGFVALNDSARVTNRQFFSVTLTPANLESLLRLQFNENSIKISGTLDADTTLVAQLLRNPDGVSETLFTLTELPSSYEMVNLPIDIPILVELQRGGKVLEQHTTTLSRAAKVTFEIRGSNLFLVGP